jgi:hypothetical protein
MDSDTEAPEALQLPLICPVVPQLSVLLYGLSQESNLTKMTRR